MDKVHEKEGCIHKLSLIWTPFINLHLPNAPNPFKSASSKHNRSVRCGHLNAPYTYAEA
jgi:hypothetical protein